MARTAEQQGVEWLAGEVSRMTGEPLEQVLERAGRERWLERAKPVAKRRLTPEQMQASLEQVRRIQAEVAALPVLDDRSADEIIGYDENGLFG